jgi:hypothetical protein
MPQHDLVVRTRGALILGSKTVDAQGSYALCRALILTLKRAVRRVERITEFELDCVGAHLT